MPVAPSPSLPVAVPLVVAAALVVGNVRPHRRLADGVAIACALAVTALCVLLLVGSLRAPIVYWFGGWAPRQGIPIGVDFAVDPLGAGLASLSSLLVSAAMLFSWRYFTEIGQLYAALMMVFLAAMVAFCLTGDLFDLFVFFELMGVAGFALAGYEIEEPGPLQGAINFGVTNTVGGFMTLTGIGLLYGRTGALNLAEIGRALARHPPDGLLVVSLLLVSCGFLVKAAVVPFHFWLPDAHAVAPTPVCILFSGVMVELGLYGVWRVYWTVFAPSLGQARTLTGLLLAVGCLTSLVGAVECFLQQHLKRLLAFSTISHAGMFLVGTALLSPAGLAGTAVYVAGHGGVKASLFLCVGILMHRFRTIDAARLKGRGARLPLVGGLFALGGLALGGLPPFGTALGKELIEDASARAHLGGIAAVLTVATVLTGAAVLREAGHVFLGIGRLQRRPLHEIQGPETGGPRGRTPPVMVVPAVGLLAAGLAVGVLPGFAAGVEAAALRFVDSGAYAAAVLQGVSPPAPAAAPTAGTGVPEPGTVVLSGASAAGAVLLALLSLYAAPPLRRLWRGLRGVRFVGWLRRLQSGDVTDYVAWLVLGTAIYGVVLALALR
ncbi:MAG TPA: proton-conducting transporter membrane subunit [Candidatus Dormibacteraeota bacterium]|nr:proton-conducting transporter membrane subunit [Candidatus Dormibacteraeota bacterium]